MTYKTVDDKNQNSLMAEVGHMLTDIVHATRGITHSAAIGSDVLVNKMREVSASSLVTQPERLASIQAKQQAAEQNAKDIAGTQAVPTSLDDILANIQSGQANTNS